jgi:hypothetical protein
MKRLEGEVTALLAELGEEQSVLALAGHTVDPHQFLGIELNPWAAAVAELVARKKALADFAAQVPDPLHPPTSP